MGFYVAVAREGEVGAGDEIKSLPRPNEVLVGEITRLYIAKRYGDEEYCRCAALQVEVLLESWKEYFRERLSQVRIINSLTRPKTQSPAAPPLGARYPD